MSSKIFSPTPIAAGIFSSLHLIDICELAPPNLVINPFILKLNNQSKPGSAFSIKTILLLILIFLC